MEVEVYGAHPKKKKHKKLHIAMFLGAIFSLILFFLIYTSFYGEIPLSGDAIIGDIISLNKSFDFNNSGGIKLESELTTPPLEIDGKFEKVELKGSSNSYIHIGDQKFYLGNIKENYLIFNNYNGKISLNSGSILEFKGKSSEISVNGVSVTPQSRLTSRVEINDSFKYESLKIDRGVSISELNYITSGTIMLNDKKEIFNINDEEIVIKNFNGDLSIKDKEFHLDGSISELEIKGDSNIKIKG